MLPRDPSLFHALERKTVPLGVVKHSIVLPSWSVRRLTNKLTRTSWLPCVLSQIDSTVIKMISKNMHNQVKY